MTAQRILLVDDEPLAIERLQILCAQLEGADVIGTAHDGRAALRLIEALAPEVILLDIAMPDLDGMDVARTLMGRSGRPAIIFVSAFDQFAVAAFEVAAVDYLLKPVSSERLAQALARAASLQPDHGRRNRTQAEAEAGWVEEFWVPNGAEIIRVAASEIGLIEAERDYMRLHIGTRSYLLHQTITDLERQLDPEKFIRIHRSTIVPRDRITGLRHDGAGNWQAQLRSGRAVRIGRTYLARIRTLVGR